jgi:hypothetical protein
MANIKDKDKEINVVDEQNEKKLDVDQIKIEVAAFAKNQVVFAINDEIKKANERYIKEKNRKVIRQRILIVFLVIGYIVALAFLINDHYFDKFLYKGEDKVIEKKEEKEKEKKKEEEDTSKEEEEKQKEEEKRRQEEEKKKQEEERKRKEEEEKRKQAELQEKYKDIFDNLKISLGNEYLDSYYKDNYTNQLILSIACEKINEDDVIMEDETYMISKEIFDKIIKEIFNIEIEHESFKYNGINFKYLKSIGYYILDKEFVKNDTYIEKKIIKIEENSHVIVETKEYYILNGEVYIPSNNKKICKEQDIDSNLDILSSKRYSFINKDNNLYLIIKEEVKA